MSTPKLAGETANRLLTTAVANLSRAYPIHWTRHITGPDQLVPHVELHPVFAGSYDWHSCVHQTWLVARLLREYPDLPDASRARDVLTSLITPDGCAVEARFFAGDEGAYWERPYGWAWLLTLNAELTGTPWALGPLAAVVRDRWLAWIREASLPIRVGTHTNTAFATGLVLDAARALADSELVEACEAAALRWYLSDTGYGGFEPDAVDFLSPALTEADLLRRVLDSGEFGHWFEAFIPDLTSARWQVLREPVPVPHPEDLFGAHLAGLVVSRAWGWRAVSAALPGDHRYASLAAAAYSAHASAAWEYVFGYGYATEHWLGTFAAYLALG